jgi:hypothetical protein
MMSQCLLISRKKGKETETACIRQQFSETEEKLSCVIQLVSYVRAEKTFFAKENKFSLIDNISIQHGLIYYTDTAALHLSAFLKKLTCRKIFPHYMPS